MDGKLDNDYNEVNKLFEIERLTKMISSHEEISIEKARSKAEYLYNSGVRSETYGRYNSLYNKAMNNSVKIDNINNKSTKIKGNIKNKKMSVDYIKKAVAALLIVSSISATYHFAPIIKNNLENQNLVNTTSEYFDDNYSLKGDSFISENANIQYFDKNKSYDVVIDFDGAAQDIYNATHNNGENIDLIIFNEFNSSYGLGDVSGTFDESTLVRRQITIMNNLFESYNNVCEKDVLDESFILYLYNDVKDYLDKDTKSKIEEQFKISITELDNEYYDILKKLYYEKNKLRFNNLNAERQI